MRQPCDNWRLCSIEVHLWHCGIKNRIRKRMLASTWHSTQCHLFHTFSQFCPAQHKPAFEERVKSCHNISFKPACSLNHTNLFCWVYLQFSIMTVVCTTKDKGPSLSNLFLSSFCDFFLQKSKRIILLTVLSLLSSVALNWLHRPTWVKTLLLNFKSIWNCHNNTVTSSKLYKPLDLFNTIGNKRKLYFYPCWLCTKNLHLQWCWELKGGFWWKKTQQ